MAVKCDFRLLGPLELDVDGKPADIGGPRQRAILALLLLRLNRAVQRPEIVERVWGPDAPATADHAVEVYISKLRQHTDTGTGRGGQEVLCSTPGGYVLRAPAESVDALRFEDLARRADAAAGARDEAAAARFAAEALALWRGPALAGLEEFEFAVAAADRLHDVRGGAAAHHARAIAGGGAPDAVQLLSQLVADFPLRESIVEQLMLARRANGDIAGAIADYHRARKALIRDLGVEPSERLRALAAELANVGVVSGSYRPARLSLPPNSIIGRDDEIAEVADLVRRHALVTITGFPGVGKSTLATEVCRRLEPEFEGGACVVDLELVRDPRDVPDQVARALGLQDQSSRRTTEVVRAYLADRHLVLAFQNVEHLAQELREGADRRDLTPGVHYLVTSVVPLGSAGEVVVNIGPLSLPATTAAGDLNASGAVALLRDRLLVADSERTFQPADADALFRIVHRLDGLPLAIELAAARTSTLTLGELADWLDRDPSLVSPRPGAGDSARRSLQSALESAYSALPPAERRLLVAAATFRGSIDMDMLLEVAGSGGARRDRQLQRVDDLVARALLAHSRVGAAQPLRMLQPTRAFVLDRTRAQVVAEIRASYIDCFARACEQRLPVLEGAGQVPALEWLENELDNVRAALRGLIDGGQERRALAIVAGMGRFWWVRGHLTEARRWLREVLQLCPEAAPARAEALRVLAYMEWSQGQFAAAEGHCVEALEMALALDDPRSVSRSLYYLGVAQHALGRLADARATFRRALGAVRALPDPALEGLVLDMLARALTSAGRQSQGRGASEKSLQLLQSAGDAFGLAVCLTNLGEAQVRDGDVDGARGSYTEALERFRALRCVVGEGYVLQGLAWIAGGAGDRDTARRLLAEMQACWDRTGYVATMEDEERNAEILGAATVNAPVSR